MRHCRASSKELNNYSPSPLPLFCLKLQSEALGRGGADQVVGGNLINFWSAPAPAALRWGQWWATDQEVAEVQMQRHDELPCGLYPEGPIQPHMEPCRLFVLSWRLLTWDLTRAGHGTPCQGSTSMIFTPFQCKVFWAWFSVLCAMHLSVAGGSRLEARCENSSNSNSGHLWPLSSHLLVVLLSLVFLLFPLPPIFLAECFLNLLNASAAPATTGFCDRPMQTLLAAPAWPSEMLPTLKQVRVWTSRGDDWFTTSKCIYSTGQKKMEFTGPCNTNQSINQSINQTPDTSAGWKLLSGNSICWETTSIGTGNQKRIHPFTFSVSR